MACLLVVIPTFITLNEVCQFSFQLKNTVCTLPCLLASYYSLLQLRLHYYHVCTQVSVSLPTIFLWCSNDQNKICFHEQSLLSWFMNMFGSFKISDSYSLEQCNSICVTCVLTWIYDFFDSCVYHLQWKMYLWFLWMIYWTRLEEVYAFLRDNIRWYLYYCIHSTQTMPWTEADKIYGSYEMRTVLIMHYCGLRYLDRRGSV